MKSMNIRPAYRYKLKDVIVSTSIFYAVMVLLVAAIIAGTINISVNIGIGPRSLFSGFGMAAAIFMFITGIVSIREDLRLFIQNGIGRKTTYLVQLLIAGSISVVLAILGELLIIVSRGIRGPDSRLIISDLYYMIFAEKNLFRPVMIKHLESIATYIALFISAYIVGVFVSLLFYRLNKIWTVIVAVGAPVFFFVGLPILISRLNLNLGGPVLFITSHPWIFIAFFVVISVVISFVNWLLLRRAPVKAASN